MGRIEDLANAFERNISAPWQRNLAGAQKAIFVVYPKEDERRLRARIGDFENRTTNAKKGWRLVDLTQLFARWMASDDYRDAYFDCPEDLRIKLDTEFFDHVVTVLRESFTCEGVDEDTVVAVIGTASLYGFLHVSEVLEKAVGDIRGRLLLFFPGSMEQDTYRTLDARVSWNYLATPITLHQE